MVVTLSEFPEPILVEILSYLPLKSLYRSRSVCKTFRRLTSDNHFVHVRLNNQPPTIMLATSSRTEFKISFVVHPDMKHDGEEDGFSNTFRISDPNGIGTFRVIDSSFGLVAMIQLLTSRIYVFNPMRSDYVVLPDSGFTRETFQYYGFGYSPVTNQYKLIRLSASTVDENAKLDLLTLGTSTWRRLLIEPCLKPKDGKLFNLNGALHWRHESSIYVFDIAKEQIQCIPSPLNCSYVNEELRVFGNSLSIMQYYYDEFDICLMKGYGIKEALIKIRLSNISSWFGQTSAEIGHSPTEALPPSESMIRQLVKKVRKLNQIDTIMLAIDYFPTSTRLKDIFGEQSEGFYKSP